MAPSTTELSGAIGHHLRRRILLAFLDGELAPPVSAGEVAADLGERVGRVAYHLKVLATAGLLQLLPASEGQPRYAWAPGIEPAWLRLVLELSADSGARS